MAQAAKSNGTTTTAAKDKPVTAEQKEPTIDDLMAQIETLKKDIGGLTKLVTDVGQSEAKKMLNTALDKKDEMQKAGEDQLQQLKATAEGYGRDAGAMMREQPAQALGIAAAIGFFLGFLMSGRR